MALDITDQDILTVAGVDYPIRMVEAWSYRGPSLAFKRLAKVTASTKRLPAISGGKIGAAVTNLTGLKITPLDPVSAEQLARIGIQTPYNIYETFIDGDPYLHLYVEKVRVS